MATCVVAKAVAAPGAAKAAAPVVNKSSFAGASIAVHKTTAPVQRRNVVVRATQDKPVKSSRNEKDLFFPTSTSLAYLDGTLPGDKGFDPLGLLAPGNETGFINPSWLPYAEIINARWAMLGAAGCIAPEILGKLGVIPQETGLVWYKAGVFPPAGSYDYWADPYTLFALELVLLAFAELKRLGDYRKPGSQAKQYFLGMENFFKGSGDPAYPGGPVFNFAGFGKDEKSLTELKNKELENGRLAMLAMLGYFVQAISTGKGPFQNLLDHLSNPTGANILTTWGQYPQ